VVRFFQPSMKPRSGGYMFGVRSISQHTWSGPWFPVVSEACEEKPCRIRCLAALKYGLARRGNHHESSRFLTSANTRNVRKSGFSPRLNQPRHTQRIDLPPLNSTTSRERIWGCDAAPNLVPAGLLAMQGR
jgi:hypothetical protein